MPTARQRYERFDDIGDETRNATEASSAAAGTNGATPASRSPTVTNSNNMVRPRGIHVVCGCCRVSLEAPPGYPVVQCFQCRSILHVPQPFLTVCSVCNSQLMTPPGYQFIQCFNCHSYLSVQQPAQSPFQFLPGIAPNPVYGGAGSTPSTTTTPSPSGNTMVVVQNPGATEGSFPDVSIAHQVTVRPLGTPGQPGEIKVDDPAAQQPPTTIPPTQVPAPTDQ